jgi:hypothetical protein
MSIEAGLLGAALALTSALSLNANHASPPMPVEPVRAQLSAPALASVSTQATTARQWAM